MLSGQNKILPRPHKNSKSSVKSLWNTIANMITKKRKHSTLIKQLNHDGNIIKDDKLIANLFNTCKYFCEIGQKLAAKIKSNTDYKAYMTNTKKYDMFLQPVTEQEIGKIIASLNIKKNQ